MDSKLEFNGFHTRSVHAGARPDAVTGSRAQPIHQTTSYVFEDPESAAAYFNLQEYGNTYSRIMNPTVGALEERIANLEGAVGGVAFASGLAAQSAALFTLLQPGDHVIASKSLYGGTITQLKHLLRKLSVDLDFADATNLDEWKGLIRDNTKLFFGETIGNPSGVILDIEILSAIAHAADIPLMIDNTFATPYLCRPMKWGADIVVHSVTKFLGGHGTSIGGVVLESGEFDWSNGRFPVVSEPSPAYHDLEFHETFGTFGYLMKLRAETLRDLGACMSPFNAFLIGLGVETLPLRMSKHIENAREVAQFLSSSSQVDKVHYVDYSSSEQKELAQKYLSGSGGAVFCFDLKGGRDEGSKFINSLQLFSHLANVGDAKSLVIHPASTTHRQLSDEELNDAGIGPGTIRLSVGIEDSQDLIADLRNGLNEV